MPFGPVRAAGATGHQRLAGATRRGVILATGADRWPMRASIARFALGMVSARRGDLDGSLHHGRTGFTFERKSLPSLLSNAKELQARFPREAAVTEYEGCGS